MFMNPSELAEDIRSFVVAEVLPDLDTLDLWAEAIDRFCYSPADLSDASAQGFRDAEKQAADIRE